MKIMSSSLSSLWMVFLNRCPSTGMSPRYGTLVSSSRCVVDRMPPSTTVCPSFTSTWVVISRVDRGHVHPARGHHHGADGVVLDIEVEDDAVVGRDLRLDLEGQHRLLELDGGGATRGGLLVRDFHALLDDRLLLV